MNKQGQYFAVYTNARFLQSLFHGMLIVMM